jgi:hypothetical protein
MKHAQSAALDIVEDLLVSLRQHQSLVERKRGVFYHKSVAFLHFHEDPAGLFADLRVGGDWQRFPVNYPAERQTLLDMVIATLPTKQTK